MDAEEKIVAATQVNSERAGQVIRELATLAADYHFASGPVSDRVMAEIVQAFIKAAVEPWTATETNGTAVLMAPEWKMTKGVGGIGDAWLELSEISTDECEHSWLEAALKAGGTMLCLELMVRPGLRDAAEVVFRDDKAVAGLWKLKWLRDEQEPRMFLPIALEPELVAQAFAQNDFDKALKPVSSAVAAAIACKADLDAVINHVRETAKRK